MKENRVMNVLQGMGCGHLWILMLLTCRMVPERLELGWHQFISCPNEWSVQGCHNVSVLKDVRDNDTSTTHRPPCIKAVQLHHTQLLWAELHHTPARVPPKVQEASMQSIVIYFCIICTYLKFIQTLQLTMKKLTLSNKTFFYLLATAIPGFLPGWLPLDKTRPASIHILLQ